MDKEKEEEKRKRKERCTIWALYLSVWEEKNCVLFEHCIWVFEHCVWALCLSTVFEHNDVFCYFEMNRNDTPILASLLQCSSFVLVFENYV